MAEAAYTAKDITVLEGLDPVRLRPGMYIGSTGSRGLHHLVYEVVDNAVDEALAGRNDLVDVTIHPDNSVTVRDTGAGIPVDVIAEQGLPALTVVLTKLHAGGKFGRRWLQGLGRPARRRRLGRQRALRVARRRGAARRQGLPAGVRARRAHGDMETVGVAPKDESGTTISFLPDSEVFEETDFDAATLLQRLRETAFLTRGLRIVLRDERAGGRTDEFFYEGGIRDFVAHVNEAKDPVHKHIVYFEGESDEGARRGRDAVEQLVRRVRLLVREQHQHAPRAARTSAGLSCRADPYAQPVRAPGGPPQGAATTTSRARTRARDSPPSSP